jgi:hypothetical protein
MLSNLVKIAFFLRKKNIKGIIRIEVNLEESFFAWGVFCGYNMNLLYQPP